MHYKSSGLFYAMRIDELFSLHYILNEEKVTNYVCMTEAEIQIE